MDAAHHVEGDDGEEDVPGLEGELGEVEGDLVDVPAEPADGLARGVGKRTGARPVQDA